MASEDIDMIDEESECRSSSSEEEEVTKEKRGKFRPLKQVQEDYQRFTQMRQRGASMSAAGMAAMSGDRSLSNPGTEVTIHCVNIDMTKC